MNNNDSNSGNNSPLLSGLIKLAAGVVTVVAAHQIIKKINEPKDILKGTENKKANICFLILGGRRVGKTTLINWLRSMEAKKAFFKLEKGYQPTIPQGESVPEMYIEFGDKQYNLAIPLDVAGDYEGGPINQWAKIYQDPKVDLNGLILMLDHMSHENVSSEERIAHHRGAWNEMIALIDKNEGNALRNNIKALYILVNKSDLWRGKVNQDDWNMADEAMTIIQNHYSDQFDMTQRIAKRFNWSVKVAGMSLENEENVVDVMSSFASHLH